VAIRKHVEDFHFEDRPRERSLALALHEGFDITSAGEEGGFSYWIAAPNEQVKTRFGLMQEVLVLYSQYANNDARVLSTLTKLAESRDFRLRLDRFVYLVIHEGSQQEITDHMNQVGDTIVIPIEASALLDPKRGDLFLRSRIAKAIGALDLYGMSSAITADKDFFGRDELVQTLATRALTHHESSGLFGLRKTGKTSVLFALERRLRDRPAIVQYTDCQNPGIHSMRWWQLLAELSLRLFSKVQVNRQESRFYNVHLIEADAALAFTHDIKLLIERCNVSIILVFDEIEYVTQGLSGALGRHWDGDFHPFWATIRATQQESRGKMTFIVAGVNPSCVETPHFGTVPNPIFQLAVPQYLEPLRVDGIRTMVRTLGRYSGLDFSELVYPYLSETYGGHPYLVRLACSEVWRKDQSTNPMSKVHIETTNFSSRTSVIAERLAQPIKDILLSLVWWYPVEYDLLRILAEETDETRRFVDDFLRSEPEKITQFARYGILKGDHSGFAIKDIQTFLLHNGLKYKNEVSPFSRTEMPQSIVAEMPDLERLSKMFTQKIEIESGLRRVVLTIVGTSVGFDQKNLAKSLLKGIKPRPDRKRPEDLFIGRPPREVISDLYTLDLKTIIAEHWDLFKPTFVDKPRFEMNMDGINKARRVDSHTTPVTRDEVEDFSNSYHWIRQKMRPLLENLGGAIA
jgi:hypothetical protein